MSLSVLIGEDNQYTALQYDKILKKFGHDVTITRDGEECLKEYEKTTTEKKLTDIKKNPFDVVVLDQSMPKKIGSEVAKEILGKKPGQRIIFASAYALKGDQNPENLNEKVEFLQKPFSLSKLIKAINGQ